MPPLRTLSVLAAAILSFPFSGLARAGTAAPPPQQVAEGILQGASPYSSSLPGISAPGPAVLPSQAPPSTSLSPAETEYFRHGKRLAIKPENAKQTFLLYVARRVFPHPSETIKNAISAAVARMEKTPVAGLSIGSSTRNGRPVALATIDRASLNRVANALAALVKTSHAETTIRSIRFSGTPKKDRPFLAKNLGTSPGSPVSNRILSDNLYGISLLPGYARADALLVPTDMPGLEDLVVKTTPSGTAAGSQIEMDNYGYAPTGAVTLNGTLDINDSLLTGDQLSALASTSFFGMNSGTLAYSAPVDLATRLGGDMSALDYRLGLGFSPWGHGATVGQLVALGLSGSNYSFDGWALHNFVKSPTSQLSLKTTLFLKEFQDTYSSTVQNDRSILGGTLELSGSATRGSLAASFDLADTEYDLSRGSGSSPQNPFYSDTQGVQNYWTENGGLRYALTPVYAVYLSTVDQQYIGGGVLDPMLQGVLGGMSNVRVLPTAALFGNDLYSGSLNLLRTDAAKTGSLVSSLFFDVGQVTGIGTQYSAMGPGIEESWTGAHLFGKADLAVPVGPLPVSALGSQIVALAGGNIQSGGIPLQLWLSLGWRY